MHIQYVLGNYMKNSPVIILRDEDKDHFRIVPPPKNRRCR